MNQQLASAGLAIATAMGTAAAPQISTVYYGGRYIPGTDRFDREASIFNFQVEEAPATPGLLTFGPQLIVDSSQQDGLTHDRQGTGYSLSLTSATGGPTISRLLNSIPPTGTAAAEFVTVRSLAPWYYEGAKAEFDPWRNKLIVANVYSSTTLAFYDLWANLDAPPEMQGFYHYQMMDFAMDAQGRLVAATQTNAGITLSRYELFANEYGSWNVLGSEFVIPMRRNFRYQGGMRLDVELDTGMYYMLVSDVVTGTDTRSLLMRFDPVGQTTTVLGYVNDQVQNFGSLAVVSASQVPEPTGLVGLGGLVGLRLLKRRASHPSSE